MKVKIGDKLYDSSIEPIMVILTDYEKELISHMTFDDVKICVYPDIYTTKNIEEFMSGDYMFPHMQKCKISS
jgi:hypothetical protein